jgi:hypothetical protein
MSTYFAAMMINDMSSLFQKRPKRREYPEDFIENLPKLVGELFTDNYNSEACIVLSLLGSHKDYRNLFWDALDWINFRNQPQRNETKVYVGIYDDDLIHVIVDINSKFADVSYKTLTLEELQGFSFFD